MTMRLGQWPVPDFFSRAPLGRESDGIARYLWKNISVLFSANMVVALLGLGTLAITAKALGPAGLGILALIEAYGRSVDQIVRLEPSQAIIRYGTEAREAGRETSFRRLVKFSTLFDCLNALIATGVALLALDTISTWLGLTAEVKELAGLFALSLLFNISATPVALLRLFSRIGLYAQSLVAVAALRLALTALLWQSGAGLEYFVLLLIFSSIAEHMVPLVLAWRVLRRTLPGPIFGVSLRGLMSENRGMFWFIINANANVLARNSTRQFDVLILGGLADEAQIGYYQVAKRVGLAALRLARPVQFVIYPVLSKLVSQGRYQRMAMLTFLVNAGMALLGMVALAIFHFYGDAFVELAFGAEFAPAEPLVLLHVLSVVLLLAGVCLNPALLSLGRDKALVSVTLFASAVFFIALGPTVSALGIIGASWMYVTFNLIWTIGCSVATFIAIRASVRDSSRSHTLADLAD